jgi:hypothetical protein
VLAVITYHGDIPWARGRFLGVDVFFVLSGFLITSLLLHEHAATGRVDLGRFWSRRARRLLPRSSACWSASRCTPQYGRNRRSSDGFATDRLVPALRRLAIDAHRARAAAR